MDDNVLTKFCLCHCCEYAWSVKGDQFSIDYEWTYKGHAISNNTQLHTHARNVFNRFFPIIDVEVFMSISGPCSWMGLRDCDRHLQHKVE